MFTWIQEKNIIKTQPDSSFFPSELSCASWDLRSYSFPCGCLQLSIHTTCSLANFPTGCEIDCEQKNVRWTKHAVCESAEHAFGWWSFCFGRTSCVCLSLKLMARSQSKAPYIAQFAVSNECIYLICGTGRQIIYTSKFLWPQLGPSLKAKPPTVLFTHPYSLIFLLRVSSSS